MKLNTHDRTPKTKNSRLVNVLLLLTAILECCIFGLGAFACFYYAKSFIGGISIILLAIFMSVIVLIITKNIQNAYIEIKENEIYVVDYSFGIKKEKHILKSDITSAQIHIGLSSKVKGVRLCFCGIQYIVFYNDKKYLFKIIYLPETAELFKQYIK